MSRRLRRLGHLRLTADENRWPAIGYVGGPTVEQFSTPVLDIPLATWPENLPNVEQWKLLLRHGIRPTDGGRTDPHRHGARDSG